MTMSGTTHYYYYYYYYYYSKFRFIRTQRGPSRLDVLSWSATNRQG